MGPRGRARQLGALVGAVAAALGTWAALAAAPEPDPHADAPLGTKSASCAECHPGRAGFGVPEATTHACSHSCKPCHDLAESHHPIGGKLGTQATSTRLLGRLGTVECFTCHDLREPRFDQEPRRSESLFHRLFRKPDLHTYYLPVSNRDGGLCRSCH
jgi:hypothetical protein